MKKMLIVFLLSVLVGFAAYGYELSIDSIDITPPPSGDCRYQWDATVINKGNTPISGYLTVQGTQCSPTTCHGAVGSAIYNLAAGQTKTATGKWIRKPGMTHFKIILRYGGQDITEDTVPLAPEPNPSVAITNAKFQDNGYSIYVKNNNNTPISELAVQCHMASAQNPNSWTACGGAILDCIPAGGTGQRNTSYSVGWNSGYDRYRVRVFQNAVKLAEQIYLPPAPSATKKETKRRPVGLPRPLGR